VGANSVELFRYQYDPNSRLTNRWTAAKGDTKYTYDAVGNLLTVTYPTSPGVANQYDALNRLTNTVVGDLVTRYTYDSASELLSEDGPWAGDMVSYTYQNRRRTALSLQQPGAGNWMQTYGYDNLPRLTNITTQAGSFGYQYGNGGAGSPVTAITQLNLPNNAQINYGYDAKLRLTSTTLANSSHTSLNSHSYQYNLGNQRTKQTRFYGDYVDYTYDNIGQVKSALAKEANNTSRLNEQFRYNYDAAGNLNVRSNNNLTQTFDANSVNELTTVAYDTNGVLTVSGTTASPATGVTVNGLNASRYADHTFARDGFGLTNGNNSFIAIAGDALGRRDTNTVSVALPLSATYTYDLNGNLLYDGLRAFEYDDENQLIRITVTNSWKSEFTYDSSFRRRIGKEFVWQSGIWNPTSETRYIYDGNLVVQERDGNNVPQLTYTRGLDLSGSLQRAGGIGGLLALSQSSAPTPRHFYYHADGNGNITALISTQQFLVATYVYDPFGNTLSAAGPLADVNPYRFSSKELHSSSGTYYYGYRYYEPSLQRWLNRDPIEEAGGMNLYAYVGNNPVSFIDPLGLLVVLLYTCGLLSNSSIRLKRNLTALSPILILLDMPVRLFKGLATMRIQQKHCTFRARFLRLVGQARTGRLRKYQICLKTKWPLMDTLT